MPLYQKWGNRCESQPGIHELRVLHGLRELRGPDGAHQPDALHARKRARLHAANGWQHWSRLYVPVSTATVSACVGECSRYQATRPNSTWRLWFIKVCLQVFFLEGGGGDNYFCIFLHESFAVVRWESGYLTSLPHFKSLLDVFKSESVSNWTSNESQWLWF